MNCHRCGEEITAPYFFKGRAYGWSCIKLINPAAKKEKNANRWVVPHSHNFDPSIGRQQVVVTYAGKNYVVGIRIYNGQHYTLDKNIVVGVDGIYINKYVIQ